MIENYVVDSDLVGFSYEVAIWDQLNNPHAFPTVAHCLEEEPSICILN